MLQRTLRTRGLPLIRCLARHGAPRLSRLPPVASTHDPVRDCSGGAISVQPTTLSGPGGARGFPSVGDSIYALSTAQGRAGIAIVRISGPSCLDIYRGLCPSKALPKPRVATVRSLYHPDQTLPQPLLLDSEALAIYFPGPKTVTGEDVLELHIHGGPATVKAVLGAVPECLATGYIRHAQPGEFTKRAFLNNRLDLAQVEALSDTLSAETEYQRRAATRGTSGALGRTYESWREQLLLARGEIEALIDFSEDQHFDESQAELLENVTRQISEMLRSIQRHELGSQRSELLRNGIKIALVGPPNVGKSSLMNLIVGREASIVSGEAGTTRDIVEASLDIRGYLCSFADTAGFRSKSKSPNLDGLSNSLDAVEEEGIRRARQAARQSDIVVVLASIEQGADNPILHYDEETLDLATGAEACQVVVNKCDAVGASTLNALLADFRKRVGARHATLRQVPITTISCREAQHPAAQDRDPGNIQQLIDAIVSSFSSMTTMPSELQDLLGVTERQRQLLVRCRQYLEEFMAAAQPDQDGVDADAVLAAEYLRYAANCLAQITGKGESGDVEDVLGVVFEKFCVGK